MADNQQPSQEYRLCKKCGTVKTINQFLLYDIARNRRRHECHDCTKARQSAWARGEIQPRDRNSPFRSCRKCGATKPEDQFAPVYSLNTRGKNYKQHTCLECHRETSKLKERRLRKENPERYKLARIKCAEKNRDKIREQKRQQVRKWKEVVFGHYGDRCVCCGEYEPSMLNIDHVNNDGAEHRRADKGAKNQFYLWLIQNGLPDGFQVLCYNCNMSKHRNGGVCAHQLQDGSTTRAEARSAKRREARGTLARGS